MLELHPGAPLRGIPTARNPRFPANAILPVDRLAVRPSYEALSAPERMVLVLRQRITDPEADSVTEADFLSSPETCDLTAAELRDNIGKARQLFDAERLAAEQRARRESRLGVARSIVLGLFPDAGQVHAALRTAGFTPEEEADLWGDLIPQAADEWDARVGVA